MKAEPRISSLQNRAEKTNHDIDAKYTCGNIEAEDNMPKTATTFRIVLLCMLGLLWHIIRYKMWHSQILISKAYFSTNLKNPYGNQLFA